MTDFKKFKVQASILAVKLNLTLLNSDLTSHIVKIAMKNITFKRHDHRNSSINTCLPTDFLMRKSYIQCQKK